MNTTKMQITRGGLLAGVCLCSSLISQAGPLDVWHARNSGVGNVLNAVGYGNGMWVVVGNEATLLSSPDGQTWTPRNVGTTAALNSIVFANGIFVVVGEAGTIRTSPNGTNWSTRVSGTSAFLYDVTYGGGRFVAVSDNGEVVTSLNGTNWTRRTTTATSTFGVTFGNGRYVSVGGVYTCPLPFWCYYLPVTYTSTDAVTWTPTSSGQSVAFSDVVFGNGKFVAAGDDGVLITSTDGTSWTRPTVSTTDFLWNVAHGEHTFVVVGGEQGSIFTSTNATDWVGRNSGTAYGLFNVGYGDGTFVAVGQYGTIIQSDSVLPPRPPRLQLSFSGNQIRLAWPGLPGTFWLEETEDLRNPSWTTTPSQQPVFTNFQTMIILPAGSGNRFYRLVGQQ